MQAAVYANNLAQPLPVEPMAVAGDAFLSGPLGSPRIAESSALTQALADRFKLYMPLPAAHGANFDEYQRDVRIPLLKYHLAPVFRRGLQDIVERGVDDRDFALHFNHPIHLKEEGIEEDVLKSAAAAGFLSGVSAEEFAHQRTRALGEVSNLTMEQTERQSKRWNGYRPAFVIARGGVYAIPALIGHPWLIGVLAVWGESAVGLNLYEKFKNIKSANRLLDKYGEFTRHLEMMDRVCAGAEKFSLPPTRPEFRTAIMRQGEYADHDAFVLRGAEEFLQVAKGVSENAPRMRYAVVELQGGEREARIFAQPNYTELSVFGLTEGERMVASGHLLLMDRTLFIDDLSERFPIGADGNVVDKGFAPIAAGGFDSALAVFSRALKDGVKVEVVPSPDNSDIDILGSAI